MTNTEAKTIIFKEYQCVNRDCDIERSCGKCDLMMPNKEPILEAYRMAMQALEQEPCEDEYIKVPKKALKYRTAGMVAYNAEWLKNHFDIERAVICGAQQPCEDAISREDLEECKELMTDINGDTVYAVRMSDIRQLPLVNPQEPYAFAKWVATEIFDEMWEYTKDTFAEIACRKLAKLGIVRAKGDEWELVEPQERSCEE